MKKGTCHDIDVTPPAKNYLSFWEIGKFISCDKASFYRPVAAVTKAHLLHLLYFVFHTGDIPSFYCAAAVASLRFLYISRNPNQEKI